MAKEKTVKKSPEETDQKKVKKTIKDQKVDKIEKGMKEQVEQKVEKEQKAENIEKPNKEEKSKKDLQKKVKKIQKNSAEEEEEPGKRYFKCIMINSENGEAVCTGRYSGKKPKQAASKACTRLYESFKEEHEDQELPTQIIFGMHECTRSSKKKKKYFYIGKRIKLDTPEEVEINKIDPKTGKKMVIKYHYNNDVRKLTDIENCDEYGLLANYDEQKGGAKNIKVAKKQPKKGKGVKKVAKKKVIKTKKAVGKKETAVKKEIDVKVKKNQKAKVSKPKSAIAKN
jgi:hypothetical protein